MPGVATGRGIAADGSGSVYLTGGFGATGYPTADFDPSESTASLTSSGSSDIFIAKYTEAMLPKRAVHAEMRGMQVSTAPNLR